ncbi:MAG: MDR/zinc-dependent alcohol dehydrogenase-like family protein [Bacillota bacterium]
MKALVFNKKLDLVNDYKKPVPATDEALVKILLAGICNTDLEIVRGYQDFCGIPGHEFVGLVEEVKSRQQGLVGKRVVGEINCGCGVCDFCIKGIKSHCRRRRVIGIKGKNGALAEYLTLPVSNLHEVPGSVSDEEAVFTEPLASVFEILEQVHIRPTDRVAVLGDGKLGLLTAMVLQHSGAELCLVGKHPEKLVLAGSSQIKTLLLEDLPRESSFNLVVEATGSQAGFELARKISKPHGTLVLKSTVAESNELNLSSLVVNEITLIGSRCGPFPPAIRALENKTIDVKPLISNILPANKALEAFKAAAEKNTLKVLVDFR